MISAVATFYMKGRVLLLLLSVAASNAAFATCIDVESQPVSVRTRSLRDSGGKAVVGANVEVRDSSGRIVFAAKSDSRGKYSIKRMKAGIYEVWIQADGFIPYKYRLVTSSVGRKVSAVKLRPSFECHDIVIADDH